MRKQHIWYECVQVVRRDKEGVLREWYDGDQRATADESLAQKAILDKQFPGTEYVVIQKIVTEV